MEMDMIFDEINDLEKKVACCRLEIKFGHNVRANRELFYAYSYELKKLKKQYDEMFDELFD